MLRDYKGDPETLPDLTPHLQTMLVQSPAPIIDAPKAMSRQQKLVLAGASLSSIFFVSIACLYLQFTIALWPIAFGSSQPTPVPTPVDNMMISLPSPTPSSTPTPSLTLTPLPTTLFLQTTGSVWARGAPHADAPPTGHLAAGTSVTVVTDVDGWVEVTWQTAIGRQRGWIPSAKITFSTPIPMEIHTPVP
jgi:hypothetical protein